MRSFSLIIAFTIFTQSVWAQSTLESTVTKFNSLQEILGNAYLQTTECTQLTDQSLSKECTFSNFCSVVTPNVDKPYLYVNNQGGKIPNMRLFTADMQATGCMVQLKAKESMNQGMAGMGNDFVETMKRTQAARVELLRTVREQNWEKDFVRFEEAVAQNGLENTETNMVTMPTLEKSQALIAKIETASGITLPPAVREKYLASMTAMLPQSKNRADIIRMASKDPFMNLLLVFNKDAAGSEEALKQNQQKIQTAIDHSLEIFEQTKKDIIHVLEEKAAANPSMAANVEAMKKRIETIAFQLPPNNPMQMSMTCPGPNAFYSGPSHSFTLCPQVLELPDTALKTIIAHELGHSIDPCTLSQPLKKIADAVPRSNGMSEAQMKAAEESMNVQGNYLLNLRGPASSGDKYIVDYFGTAQQGLQQGFSNFRLEDSGAGVALQDHPFSSVIQCLSTPGSLGARASNKEVVREQLQQSVTRLLASGASESDPRVTNLQGTIANLDGLYSQIGACSFLPGNTQLQEAFSDWIAGEVAGNDLKVLTPEKKRQYAYESFSFFTGMDCNKGTLQLDADVQKFVKEAGCMEQGNSTLNDLNTIMMNAASNADSHSHGIDRVEKLFVAQPEIKKALGCEGEGATHCE